MALNPNALLLPTKGTVYVGAPDAPPPTVAQLATMSPTAPPTGFQCIGHTSRENLPAYGKDGGDVTQLGSWWDEGVDAVKDPETWNLTFSSLQCDSLTLGLAFAGGTLDTVGGTYDIGDSELVSKSLLLQMGRGVKWRGFYHPNTSINTGDLPELAVDAFLEFQLVAQLLKSASTTAAWKGRRWRIIDEQLIAAA